MRIKQTTFILIFLLATFFCFAQNEYLHFVEKQYDGILKEYYDSVYPLLYSDFSGKPYARYISMPSFSEEYAFSVEKIKGKSYIISNTFSESYWYAGYENRKDSVKIITIKTEISKELYIKIGELFEILSEVIIEPKRTGLDGTTYYFTTTNKKGEIKITETWSPQQNSLLGRLIRICDYVFSIGVENNISEELLLKGIEIFIKDLRINK